MYDLHTHSLLSDGVLLPSEVAVRYAAKGYKAIAITDHSDYSNIKQNVSAIIEMTSHWPADSNIKVLPGIELTHIPPSQFKVLSSYARSNGIKVIIGHGETPAEPVIKGTNRAALESDINILAHPGLILEEDVVLAKEKGIFLEVTARHGHRKTNSHVISLARKIGAKLILNTDSHKPEDILLFDEYKNFALMNGLGERDFDIIMKDTEDFVRSLA